MKSNEGELLVRDITRLVHLSVEEFGPIDKVSPLLSLAGMATAMQRGMPKELWMAWANEVWDEMCKKRSVV